MNPTVNKIRVHQCFHPDETLSPSGMQEHRIGHKHQATQCEIQISQLNISLRIYFLQVSEKSN